MSYSRGLYGKAPKPKHIEKILKDLSLWDKKDQRLRQLSGGMKRRVLIAKALSHEPSILFLDEPTAGVDVELRQDMWKVVEVLRKTGVTIILTTHYIEEAEAIADKVGIINKGELLLIEGKTSLMQKFGQKILKIELQKRLNQLPQELSEKNVKLSDDGLNLTYIYDTKQKKTGITKLLSDLSNSGINLRDIQTDQSSLEEIFVNLVTEKVE